MDATMSTNGRVVVTDHAGQYGGMTERRMWTVGSVESRRAADAYAEVRAKQLADEQEEQEQEDARDAVDALLKGGKAALVMEALREAGLID
jgi:hypothetical protein